MKIRRIKNLLVGLALVGVTTTAAAEPLFKTKEGSVESTDLSPGLRQRYFSIEERSFQAKKAIAEDALLDTYFATLAKKQNKTTEDIQKELLQVADPSEKELKDFYEEKKDGIPYPYEQIKDRLKSFVKDQKVQEKRQGLVAKAKQEIGFDLLVEAPVAPVMDIATDKFIARGKKDAKVVVVEFADYLCPHCKSVASVFEKIYASYDSKVKFVFIDFPVVSKDSTTIAQGAYCANEQDKYWEYHKMAFEKQGQLAGDPATELAKAVGLDEKKFANCFKGSKAAEFVAMSKAEGERIGVTGTPSVYVNGAKVARPDFDGIEAAIKGALAAI